MHENKCPLHDVSNDWTQKTHYSFNIEQCITKGLTFKYPWLPRINFNEINACVYLEISSSFSKQATLSVR